PPSCSCFQVFNLVSVRGCFQCGFKRLPLGAVNQLHKVPPDHLLLSVASLVAPSICVADEACRIEHQNHALCCVQNFLIEVSFSLQLRLEHFLFGDVQHKAAHLCDS